jgi:hypothetical protein
MWLFTEAEAIKESGFDLAGEETEIMRSPISDKRYCERVDVDGSVAA